MLLFSKIYNLGNDCTFETGQCGWHNYDDIFDDVRGQWFIYNSSSQLYNTFCGLEKDVNFPLTTGIT